VRSDLYPAFKHVGMLYSFVVFVFLTIGSKVQHDELYSGLLITEFILILVPCLALLYIFRYNVKEVLRINKVGVFNLFLILFIMILAIPVVNMINIANLWIIRLIFGRVELGQVPIANSASDLLLNLLVLGGAAAICEEIMFRGVIQRSFERIGQVKAILITAFLFGLLHIDFQKLLGTFLLGSLIGFIVYRTNSIFSGMFAHFVNNSSAVVLGFISTKLPESAGITESGGLVDQNGINDFFAQFDTIPAQQLTVTVVVALFLFAFFLALLVGFMAALIKNTDPAIRAAQAGGEAADAKASSLWGTLWFIPGLAMIGLVYTYIGLQLKGDSLQFVDNIIRFVIT
jgi:membrane protease YdiL (CAAX protease family)